jgi:hypothetical protein
MLRNVAVAAGNSRDEEGREEGREEGKEEAEEEEELLRVLKEVLEGEEDEMVKEHLASRGDGDGDARVVAEAN